MYSYGVGVVEDCGAAQGDEMQGDGKSDERIVDGTGRRSLF